MNTLTRLILKRKGKKNILVMMHSTSQTPKPSGLRMQGGRGAVRGKPAEVPPMAPKLSISGAARRKLKEVWTGERGIGHLTQTRHEISTHPSMGPKRLIWGTHSHHEIICHDIQHCKFCFSIFLNYSLK
jgi:hypothetical protein